MSEVKGTLLTIILVLAVFASVFTVITIAFQRKAADVSSKIEHAGETSEQGPAVAGANTLVYHY